MTILEKLRFAVPSLEPQRKEASKGILAELEAFGSGDGSTENEPDRAPEGTQSGDGILEELEAFAPDKYIQNKRDLKALFG